jgi:hypothetical protein
MSTVPALKASVVNQARRGRVEGFGAGERSGGNAFLAEELLAAGERGALVPATVRSLMLALARSEGHEPPTF